MISTFTYTYKELTTWSDAELIRVYGADQAARLKVKIARPACTCGEDADAEHWATLPHKSTCPVSDWEQRIEFGGVIT
jgi:hypothetical protein